ncbi:hypothetical protein [Methanotorris igneus]|uniref:Uncharacterized protein n=1 Tax=Methanotorris igneus (strain DSM 5666 / JCM 11834 / Kol 5) TaxID=880724 RepID=F6BBC8_METIK|nr:hypothetical protein [Methanotorris igneus]AEF97135.1 hypothetical protein Metig_1602 [Methanotorris igneus Kol 5]
MKIKKRLNPKILNAIILGCCGIALIASALYYSNQNLKVEIELFSANDTHEIYRYDELTIRLKNLESFTINPIFFINNGVDKKSWDIVTGPKSLKSGEEAIYVLRAPDADVAIEANKSFYIEVRDLSTGFSSFSQHYKLSSLRFPGIQNPSFYYWTYDPTKNIHKPFAWDATWWKIEKGEVAVLEKKENAVYLAVSNLTRKSGSWLMSGVQQAVDFPKKLRIVVKPMFSTPISKYPPYAAGIELADGNKRVWIVFTNETDEPILLKRYGELTYALYFVPTKIGKWNNITVNVESIYKEMGWNLPPKILVKREGNLLKIREVNLLAFVACYPGSECKKFEVYYKLIKCEERL